MSHFKFECNGISFSNVISFFKANHLKSLESKIVFVISADSIALKKVIFPKNNPEKEIVVLKTTIEGTILEFEYPDAVIVFPIELPNLKNLVIKCGKWVFSHKDECFVSAKTEDTQPLIRYDLPFQLEQALEEEVHDGFNVHIDNLNKFDFKLHFPCDDTFTINFIKDSLFIKRKQRDFVMKEHMSNDDEANLFVQEFKLREPIVKERSGNFLMQQLLFLNHIPDKKSLKSDTNKAKGFDIVISESHLVVRKKQHTVILKQLPH